ncbi:MAG: hypothetical protein HGA16_00510 [Candidatus Moranbacteria bacterium]|nr:hypothetical protein [Candidatus Moranbacteria bacterium]
MRQRIFEVIRESRKNRGIAAAGLLFLLSGIAALVGVFAGSFFLPLLVAFSVGAVILFFIRPDLFLFLFLIIRMSLDYSSQYITITLFDVTMSFSQILGIAIAAMGLLLVIREGKRLRTFPLLSPFLIIAVWGIASTIGSIAVPSSAQEILRIFDLFVIAFFSYSVIRTETAFRRLLIASTLAFIVPIGVGIYQLANGIGFQDEAVDIPRIYGTFAHPNVFSLSLVAAFAVQTTFLLSYARNRMEKTLSTVALLIIGIALLLTYSRVAWVALAIFLFLLALARFRKLLIPLILLPLMLIAVSSTMRDRVLESFNPKPDSSIVWRQTLWNDVTKKTYLDGREWYGYGISTFPKVSEDLRGIRLGSNDAHNDYVKFFIDGGYTGLIAFLAYIVLILFSMLDRYRPMTAGPLKDTLGILLLLFLSLEASAFSDNVFKNTPLWFLFFAILGAAFGQAKGLRREQN